MSKNQNQIEFFGCVREEEEI